MHHGIFSCAADAPIAEAAAIMAHRRVHAVVVTNGIGQRPIGVVSDLDVVAAAASGVEGTASEIAATEPLAVSADTPIQRAAQLMSEHAVTHLVVIDGASGYPVGVISSLDVAVIAAGPD
jgi:CBS domain-containing protein